MIKTAIKHYLYEICISVLFDNIILNFGKVNYPKFKSGDTLTHVVLYAPSLPFQRIFYTHVKILAKIEDYVIIEGYRNEYNYDGSIHTFSRMDINRITNNNYISHIN